MNLSCMLQNTDYVSHHCDIHVFQNFLKKQNRQTTCIKVNFSKFCVAALNLHVVNYTMQEVLDVTRFCDLPQNKGVRRYGKLPRVESP